MKKIIALLTLSAVVMLTGCGENDQSVPTEIIVDGSGTPEDSAGVFPVKLADGTVIDHSPDSIASLSPAATEIIAELGFGRLCAVSRYCDFPEGICTVTVGSSENPDIDRITELSPEVLFTLTPLAEREEYALESAGITVVELESPDSAEAYGNLYGTIATVFGGEEAGKSAAEKAVESLKSAAQGVSLGDFLYVSPKLTAAGSGTFENAVLSLCGNNMCTADGYTSSAEDISGAPQYIIAADSLTAADITGSELLSGFAADADMIFVPAERFERPSARISEVFAAIREQLSDTAQTDE